VNKIDNKILINFTVDQVAFLKKQKEISGLSMSLQIRNLINKEIKKEDRKCAE